MPWNRGKPLKFSCFVLISNSFYDFLKFSDKLTCHLIFLGNSGLLVSNCSRKRWPLLLRGLSKRSFLAYKPRQNSSKHTTSLFKFDVRF